MTVSALDLGLYTAALFVLFLTPGPVWLALIARAVSGGFAAAWPLAVGVVIGDVLWPLLAILGASQIVTAFDSAMTVLRLVAAAIFWILGISLWRHADRPIGTSSRLTAPGAWAGFAAGVAVILGNPKAILFYMGVLPGFFDLTRVTGPDIAAIVTLSALVPLVGNLLLAVFLGRARALVSSPPALRRLNRISGALLVAVGCVIPFT